MDMELFPEHRSFADDYPELVGTPRFQEAYGEQVSKAEYGLDVREAGERGVSMTKQSMRDEVDINNVIARYHDTGFLPQVENLGVFRDVSEYGDYRQVLERVKQVEEVFMQFPADTRAKFQNEAANFIEFMVDVENGDADKIEEARALGILAKEDPKPADGRPVEVPNV